MKAIILCAGHGKRMRPYTDLYQKTMIPVCGKPLLEHIINGLKHAGFKDIILVVGYLKEQIINYFQNGSKWGINIEYIEQKIINGTGGALLLCQNSIKDSNFFLTWGDILVPYRIYKEIYDTFEKFKEDFILVANYQEDLQKGCEIFCENDYCANLIEKPEKEMTNSNLNNCGIFILSVKIFEVLESLKPSIRGELELPTALCKGINENKWKIRVLKMKKNDLRGDFGDIDEYNKLKDNFKWLDEIYKH